eukprot:s1453_g2.t1
MAEGTSEESYEAIFLIDGSALGSSSSRATCSAHHLDDAERLVACCQQVQERCPSARIRAFVSMEGVFWGGSSGNFREEATVGCVTVCFANCTGEASVLMAHGGNKNMP